MEKLVLHDEESAAVGCLIDELSGESQFPDPFLLVERADALAHRLPLRLREFLGEVRSREIAVAVVSNLPVRPDLEPTPVGWEMAAKAGAGRTEELVLMLCSSALGAPFGWANQQDGRLVHDVCPTPEQVTSLTSASSSVLLSLHTEDVFHECRADYVALSCLRNDDRVGTTVTRLAALGLGEAAVRTLAEPRFKFFADDSHIAAAPETGGGNRLGHRPYEIGSVLFGPQDRGYLRFDYDFMAPAGAGDPQARAVIEDTQRLLIESTERVVLSAGDLLLVDNYQVVHGREPFRARFDGRDRWLKRVNVIRDLRRLHVRADRRSRIIAGSA